MKLKLTVAVLIALLSVSASKAANFYFQVEGSKQGKFVGETQNQNMLNFCEGVKFFYEVKSPRDVSTGLATGRRQHRPITITKEWGAASPQLFQALTTNEVLKTVTINFVKPNADGLMEIYQTIVLTNAYVSDIKYTKDYDLTNAQSFVNQSGEFEEISFTFQKITITNVKGKTSAMDDWKQ